MEEMALDNKNNSNAINGNKARLTLTKHLIMHSICAKLFSHYNKFRRYSFTHPTHIF